MARLGWLSVAVLLCAAAPLRGATIAWSHLGPGGGGWIESVACDPRDPDTLYLGCDVGGFFISHDAGRTWQIQNEGLNDYFVECIAVAPADSRTLLLGTEGGIFRSTDQGTTWTWQRAGFPSPERHSFSAPIGALAFDPTRPNVVYAGIGRPRWNKDGKGQIYRSDDGGQTWTLATRPGMLDGEAIVSDLEVSPDGTFVLAATDRGMVRSDDGGQTWLASGSGLAHGRVEELAIAPSDPRVVYCTLRTTARDAAPFDGGVWRSDDAGRTWAARYEGLAARVGRADQPAPMSSSYKEIVVDPRDADTAYVGDHAWVSAGVSKTTDGGRTWSRVTRHTPAQGNMDYGWIGQWGPSVMCLALAPAHPDRLIFGTSGHVFLTDDAGDHWAQRYCRVEDNGAASADARFSGTGLEVTCFHDIVLDPHLPDRLYFCYYDIGLLVSDDRGRTFRKATTGMAYPGNCFTVTVAPEEPGTLWAGTGEWGSNRGDVCRSLDGGQTWKVVGKPESGLPDGQTKHLIVDPASAVGRRTLFVTSRGHGVYRSDDGGDSWQPAMANLPEPAVQEPRGLLLDPRDSRHLRLALGGSPAQGSGIYETRDGGQSWRQVDSGALLADIQAVQADPHDFSTLYVCQRESFDRAVQPPVLRQGGLLRSTDGGVTWQRLHDFRFARCVAVSPRDRNTLYLGTTDHPYHDESRALGVLKSSDGGRTWQPETRGLTCWNVSCICIDPRDPRLLFVGTAGNGAAAGADSAAKP